MKEPMNDLLSTHEAAHQVGISYRGIMQAIWQGRLKARKMGRDYTIRQEDLEEFKRSREGGKPR